MRARQKEPADPGNAQNGRHDSPGDREIAFARHARAHTASGGHSGGVSAENGASRRRDARTASRRSTSVVGARAATTAAACSGAARVRSINWPARNTWRRTATPWNTTSTRRREWSPACNTHGRRCKHSCFSSSRRSAAWAFSEQPRLLARRGARRSRSFARGGGTCPCAPTR